MPNFPGLRRFFRLDRGTDDVAKDVDTEIGFHFEMKVQELVARGLSADEARTEAMRRFGDVERTRARLTAIDRDRVVRARRIEWLEGFAQDVRYAVRGLRLKPGFTAGVVITLSLGIGANAAMFGIADRLLFRPPNYLADAQNTHRLYFGQMYNGEEFITSNSGYRVYMRLGEWTKSFDRMAAFFFNELAVGTGDQAREMQIGLMTASTWKFFDARPVIGRFFLPEEDKTPEGAAVAVLAYDYWQTAYGGARDVLGKPINIGRRVYTIIGVAPKGFSGPVLQRSIAFVPITAGVGDLFGGMRDPTRYYMTYNMRWLELLVHRKPGVSVDQATADANAAYRRSYLELLDMSKGRGPAGIAEAKPRAILASILRDRGPRQSDESKVATWLVGVAGIVLLVACANVANLLLARALRRRREIAVRLALGVSRGRLLAQLLTESLVLALLGAVGGLAIAQWGGGLLRASFLKDIEMPNAFLDGRTLLFAGALALVVGLLAGFAPAFQSGRADVAASLKAGSREGTFHRSRLRTGLLIGQAALSVVLLTGAGLFVRSVRNVNDVHLGYDPDQVMAVQPEMRGVTLDSAQRVQLRERLMERARAIPGVEGATRTASIPFWMTYQTDIFVPGIDSVQRLGDFITHTGDPDYFRIMGTRLVRGRAFTSADRAGAPRVMVVSESMAKRLWPGKDAIGQCVKMDADTMPCNTVVGIAETIRNGNLTGDVAYQYYVPAAQYNPDGGALLVRTRGEARRARETVRRELQREMPGASYVTTRTLRDIIDPNFRSWQLGATMFGIFGALALVLSAVGLYSTIAYTVTQRTHEMGVRVALGAQSGDVVRLILREGLRVAIAGIVLGTLVALAASRFVAKLLFDVPPKDPITITLVAATLLVVAIVACVVPARRAAGVDPNVALRAD